MGAAERVDLWVRGCSDACRRPMGLPRDRLRRGLGLPSSLRAGALQVKQIASVLLDASRIIFWCWCGHLKLFCGILQPLHPKELLTAFLEPGLPRAAPLKSLQTACYSFAACLDAVDLDAVAAKDARRPAHARRGPLAPALHERHPAPLVSARREALPAPVRAPPARSRRCYTWFTVSVARAAVADEFGRPDGPGRLARGKRHGRTHPEARRAFEERSMY